MYSAELKKIVEVFELESVLPELSLEGRSVLRKEINRPALQLAGFYERFDSDRLQVIGRVEYSYLLSLNDEDRKNAIRHLFQYHRFSPKWWNTAENTAYLFFAPRRIQPTLRRS